MSTAKSPTTKQTGLDGRQAAVLAFEMPSEDSASTVTAPEWVQVFPLGPEIHTNDGRFFRLSDPAALVAMIEVTLKSGPILVDYEHRSYYGVDSQAAGWCSAVEARADGIWARIDWTEAARQKIEAREYRFISPEFHAHVETSELLTLDAISLVNRPAFTMAAIAAAQLARAKTSGDQPMKNIAAALGLAEDATEEAILAKINEGKTELASARLPPAPDKYMPRADYDTAIARANTAETELATLKKAGREAEIETVIAAAIKEGKIAPASKTHYLALAQGSVDGFEQVKQLCASLPKVITDPQIPGGTGTSGDLTEYELHIASSMGLSAEDYKKAKGA